MHHVVGEFLVGVCEAPHRQPAVTATRVAHRGSAEAQRAFAVDIGAELEVRSKGTIHFVCERVPIPKNECIQMVGRRLAYFFLKKSLIFFMPVVLTLLKAFTPRVWLAFFFFSSSILRFFSARASSSSSSSMRFLE